MLRVVHGDRVELLLAALVDELPPADPFAPTTVVTGSRLIARWLAREIAFARGIASGLELVSWTPFVERVWAGDDAARRAGIGALDRGRLGAALASVLADLDAARGDAHAGDLAPVTAYLAAAPAPGDRAGPRRVQLAEHLASLMWAYALTRPDWMPALVAGQIPHELAASSEASTARWQARLIEAALARIPGERRWAPAPMLPWLRRRVGLPPPRLDRPVIAFGVSLLARAQLEALTDLATTTDVTVYVLDPCEELWDDVGGRRSLALADPGAPGAGHRATDAMMGIVASPGIAAGGVAAGAGVALDTQISIDAKVDAVAAGTDDHADAAIDAQDTKQGAAIDAGIAADPDVAIGAQVASVAIDAGIAIDPAVATAQAELDVEASVDAFEAFDAFAAFEADAREDGDPIGDAWTGELPGDPLPLVLWGRPVRDTLAALVERSGGDIDDRFAELSAAPRSARERLLADVRVRRLPEAADATAVDAGVGVLACPNPRREVEVIATEVRRMLDADPALSAHDIGVWIASRADDYLALAPSAFEAVGVPCHLVDAPIDDRGRIGEAVLALLELPTSAMARRDLLRVMTHPAVLAAHPHVDAADWVRWTERLGIAHGADAHAHANTYLADVAEPDHAGGFFHWDQGVRRLALGAFMVGDRARRGPARIGGRTLVVPEELRADQLASAATYALLVRSLCADAAWLAVHVAPLARWAEVLAALVDQYLAPRDEESTRDLERTRKMLANLAQLDVDGRALGFREVREHVIRKLASMRAYRGEPLATGVMIAPLAAMRSQVPFRIAFVAGLDEGAFPAGDRTSPLDLRRRARHGDVSPRDRDRAAFLDVLLCARDRLYLSYVAVEAKSGQPLGPSSVVLELADALAPYLGAGLTSREALDAITTHHPLHRFGHAHHPPGDRPDGDAARERWASMVRDELREHLRRAGHPIPDEDGQLALLAHPSQAALRVALGVEEAPAVPRAVGVTRPLSIANLRGFLEWPIQAWAAAVLDLAELPDADATEHGDEPFHLDSKARAMLLREVFSAYLCDPATPLEVLYDARVQHEQLRGQFPVGVFARAARELHLKILDAWHGGLATLTGGLTAVAPLAAEGGRGLPPVLRGATRYGFGRLSTGRTLQETERAELLPPLVLELSGSRTVRLVGQTELLMRDPADHLVSIVPILRDIERRSVYHLRGAFDHVVLAAAGVRGRGDGHIHRLLDPRGKVSEIHHEPWTQHEARAYLAELASELLDRSHGYLLPFETLAKALGGKPSPRTYGDPTHGLGYGPIKRRDGLELPSDAVAMAQRRLRPLVERMRGDHGFEISRSTPPTTRPPLPRPPAPPPPTTPPGEGGSAPTRGSRPVLQVIKGGRS